LSQAGLNFFTNRSFLIPVLDGAPPGTIDDPVVLDGHYSHTRHIDVIKMACSNLVAIIFLPPHKRHKIQPLDVAFMNSFKTYYAEELKCCQMLIKDMILVTIKLQH
jgi:hypothetical protein